MDKLNHTKNKEQKELLIFMWPYTQYNLQFLVLHFQFNTVLRTLLVCCANSSEGVCVYVTNPRPDYRRDNKLVLNMPPVWLSPEVPELYTCAAKQKHRVCTDTHCSQQQLYPRRPPEVDRCPNLHVIRCK